MSLLDGIRGRDFDVILAVAEDRLTRSSQEKIGLQADCAKAGVTWHTLSGGKVDPSTAEGGLLATITGALAQYESSVKADRLARSVQRRLNDGADLGGRRPFGWTARLNPEIVPAEAELIRAAHRMILDGKSVWAVARAFDASEFRPVGKAEKWRTQSVRQLLLRPRNAGRLVVKGVDYGAHVPAIVTEEEHAAVVAILTDPSRRPVRGPKPQQWTAMGLVTCGVCGSRLEQIGTRDKSKRALRCAKEGRDVPGRHPIIQADILEAEIADRTVMHLMELVAHGALTPDDSESAEATALRVQLAELGRQRLVAQQLALAPGADVDAAMRMIAELGAQFEAVEERLNIAIASNERSAALDIIQKLVDRANAGESGTVRGIRENFTPWWSGLELDARRRLLRWLFDSMTIHPGRGGKRLQVINPHLAAAWGNDEAPAESAGGVVV